MARLHEGFPFKTKHLATFYSQSKVSPGDVMKLYWDGRMLATCDVNFNGEWHSTDCYCEVDRFGGVDLESRRYVFKVWDKDKGRTFSLVADDPAQKFGEQ